MDITAFTGRVRWFVALFAVALISACGGGGSSSSSGGVTPSTPSPLMTATVTATATPSPAPTGASVIAGASAQTASFTGSGAVASVSVSVPPASIGTGSLAFAISAVPPSGVSIVQSSMRKLPAAIGGTLSPLSYLTLTATQPITFASSFGLSFTLVAGQSIPAGANVFVAIYDPTNASAGWSTYLATVTSSGQTVSFGPIGSTLSLQANVQYVFALFSSPQVLSPQTSATTYPGGSVLTATLNNVPAAAHSATFTITPVGALAVVNLAPITPGCAPTCVVSVSAPGGTGDGVSILFYASVNGTGAALARAVGTANLFPSQTTQSVFTANGIAASYALNVSLSPATSSLMAGFSSTLSATASPLDSAGEPAVGTATTTTFASPAPTFSLNDPSGVLSSSLFYNGLGIGTPISYTLHVSGYPDVTSSPIPFTAAAAAQTGYALDVYPLAPATSSIQVSPTGSATISRLYSRGSVCCSVHPRFDASGTLWGFYAVGIKPDATAAGTFAPLGKLLTFDPSGNVWMSDATINALDEYGGPLSTTLIRQIVLPDAVSAAAVDTSGSVFALHNGALSEYASTGSGTLTPIASTRTYAGLPGIDASGTLYAASTSIVNQATVNVWAPGAFVSGVPNRTIVLPLSGPTTDYGIEDFAVDPAGNAYLVVSLLTQSRAVYYAAAGQSVFSSTPLRMFDASASTVFVSTLIR